MRRHRQSQSQLQTHGHSPRGRVEGGVDGGKGGAEGSERSPLLQRPSTDESYVTDGTYPGSKGAQIAGAGLNAEGAVKPSPGTDPIPPPFSPDVPGRPTDPHRGHVGTPGHTCPGAVVGHYACHDAQAKGVPDPTLRPFSPDIPGKPKKADRRGHARTHLAERSELHVVYNPKDRYGIPLYHSIPASSWEYGREKGEDEAVWKTHRLGVMFLVFLALLVLGHTAQVVHSALQDLHDREAVRTLITGGISSKKVSASGTDEVQCVDLQGLTWSEAIPLDPKTGTPAHNEHAVPPPRGSGAQSYMWLSSTHLTLPLHSPIFALFGGHVRGNIGVLGSHASATADGSVIDVLVEIKVQSSHSSILQETGAWRELAKYGLCRVSRSPRESLTDVVATDHDQDEHDAKTEGIDLRKHTRAPTDHDDGITFDMQILLPPADVQGTDEELYVPRMEVGVVQGDIAVDVPGVRFGKVELWTRDGEVHLGKVRAGEVKVHTGKRG